MAASEATYSADDLQSIVVSAQNAPDGLTVELGDSGQTALVLPLPPGATIDDSAFHDALTTRISHTMTGGYTSWTAVFATSADAQEAFELIAELHESDAGWGLQAQPPDLDLAEDAVQYAGAYGPWDTAGIYFWREENLLLAALGVGDFHADVLQSIAEGMDARAD